MTVDNVQIRVDCSNMACPKPSLMAKKMVGDIAPGQAGELIVDMDALNRVSDILVKQGANIIEMVKKGNPGRVLFTRN